MQCNFTNSPDPVKSWRDCCVPDQKINKKITPPQTVPSKYNRLLDAEIVWFNFPFCSLSQSNYRSSDLFRKDS